MNVKEASERGKQWIVELFGDENITNLGLEEIKKTGDTWRMTMAFSRPWNTYRDAVSMLNGSSTSKRTYKILTINDAGDFISIEDRLVDAA